MLHPLRLRILQELAEPDSATGLARRIGLPRQQLNYHLRQLEDQALVEVVGERQRRGCTERLLQAVARSYLIGPSTLGPLAADPRQVQDQVSSAYLVAVAGQVIRDLAGIREEAGKREKRVPTLTLQAEVSFASPEAQHAFAEELTSEVARLVAKYHEDWPGSRHFRLIAGAYPAPQSVTHQAPQEEGHEPVQ